MVTVMEDITEEVGQLIRAARIAKGLTQPELAERMGVTKATVNGYEVGKQNLTVITLKKIATALGVPFKIFFG